ncbi:MAG: biotin/lipoyl-binding protein [Bacteroidaceae bacterium]|nr:biotin/lipoyl-binding protein [Bacteroidaceae bacterium]
MKNFKFKIGDKDYEAVVVPQEDNKVEVTVNGKAYTVEVERAEHKAAAPVARPVASAAAAAPQSGSAQMVKAPLPGNITKVLVKAGQAVKAGEVLLTMEAMKMENNVVADFDCTVKKVVVSEGQSVNGGDNLIEVESAAAPAAAPQPAPVKAAAPAAAPAAPAKPAAPAAGAKTVNAPLPGNIVKIACTVGQQVAPGDVLIVMEAMKMENNIVADSAGTVKAILVQQGNTVQSGDALVEIA